MALKDEQRWQDWRSSRERPFRERPRCRDCGEEFWLLIERQELCHICAWAAVQTERVGLALLELGAEQERHRRVQTADYSVLAQRAATLAKRKVEQPTGKGSRGARSAPDEWLPLARKKERQGWNHRKIAAFLGIDRKEVGYWLSLKDADSDRFIAACRGQLRPGNKALSEDPRLLWCRAKYESQCRMCRGTIFVGDRMTRVDDRWTHAKCAEAAGYEIVQVDVRSDLQRKKDRLLNRTVADTSAETP